MVAAVILAAAIGLALWSGAQVRKARAAQWTADTARANTLARADTARQSLVMVGDSLRVVSERLVIQQEVNTELAQQLGASEGEKGVLATSVAVLRRRLELSEVGIVVQAGDTIVAEGELDARDSLGVRVSARVAVANDLARWSWDAVREPATLALAVTCDDQQAVVRVSGPPWLDPRMGPATQDPEVCIPRPTEPSWPTWRVLTVVGGCALAGVGAAQDNLAALVAGGLACGGAVAWDALSALWPPWL